MTSHPPNPRKILVIVKDHRVTQILGYVVVVIFLFLAGARVQGASHKADTVNRNLALYNARQIVALKKVNEQQQQAVKSLCAFTEDLKDRIAGGDLQIRRSRKFLLDNPKGTGAITGKLIQQGIQTQQKMIDGQRRTLSSLTKYLTCPVPPIP